MDDEINTAPPRTPSPQSLGVPVAIVVAGGLIALSIYFGGSKQTAVPQPSVAVISPAQPAQPSVGPIRPVADDDHVRGSANANVTIVEYSDLECPFCKQFHVTMQRLMQEYPQDLRWVYRHHPIPQLHQQATAEAVATECAGEQSKFWELLDKIYAVTPSNDGLNLADLPTYAREVGVANITAFETCRQSDKYNARIDRDSQDVAQVGTPYSVVWGAKGQQLPINGAQPYAQVKALVDQVLAQ